MVCLDIFKPGLLNLLFYDLLGVINQTENGTKLYLVKLVKNFVKDYIKSENVFVFPACSIEGDIANFSAFRILRNLKAKCHCINKPLYSLYGAPLTRSIVSFIC